MTQTEPKSGRALLRARYAMEDPVALISSRSLDIASDDWRAMSACRDTDPSLFFPVGTTGPALDQIASAKGVCETCEVAKDCLRFALETNQDSGVWGGLSEEERRQIRRKARAAAAHRSAS